MNNSPNTSVGRDVNTGNDFIGRDQIITHLNIDKLVSLQLVNIGNNNGSLVFLTENEICFNNFQTGLSLNFSLRNMHDSASLVYSIKLELLDFFDKNSNEFLNLLNDTKRPQELLSAPIIVYGINVSVSAHDGFCEVTWGGWEDSTASRGQIYRSQNNMPYDTMFGLIRDLQTTKSSRFKSEFELCPPTKRFAIATGEVDCFHCQISGVEEGIYICKLLIGYHVQNTKMTVSSDETYIFVKIDWLSRNS